MFRISLLIVLILLFLALPIMAQEATEAAPEDTAQLGSLPDPSVIEQEASNTLTENALFLAFAAPLVMMLTSLIKPLPFLTSVPAPRISLVLNILIWVGYVVAKEYGGAAQFETVVSSVTSILAGFLGVSLTGAGASLLYNQAAKQDVPVFGHRRT